jgi:hypothetical protein|tara:strand:- start:6532 stop:6756 length:225 start_codon:yes stop_codon:yes gene_type:complete
MKGTAKRTENPIISETPGAVDISTPIMAMTISVDIGIEIRQNKLHLLMILFFNIVLRSVLIYVYCLKIKDDSFY